jgi:peptidoglycan-N-acetylmuramic acid deacetylase
MRKNDLWIVGVALLAAIILFLGQFTVAIPTGAWGLSFREEGESPVAPASQALLESLDAAYLGNTEEKVLYLTFDAGYENGCTEQILDILKKHDVKAAFFLVGNYIEKNADLVRRMVEDGHIVGNHTMHHPDMSKLSTMDAFSQELKDLEALFFDTTGHELPRYYRPPQGIYSEQNLKMAQQLGYKTVFWSLAYADWDVKKQPTESFAMEKLTGRIHNGAILLLHSTSKTNAAILDRLLTELKQQGYTFRSIDSLFI